MYVVGLNVVESILDDIRHHMSFRHFLQELTWYGVSLDVSPNLVVGNHRQQAVMMTQSADDLPQDAHKSRVISWIDLVSFAFS